MGPHPNTAVVIISFFFKDEKRERPRDARLAVCRACVHPPFIRWLARATVAVGGVGVTETCQLCLLRFVGSRLAFLFIYLNLNGLSPALCHRPDDQLWESHWGACPSGEPVPRVSRPPSTGARGELELKLTWMVACIAPPWAGAWATRQHHTRVTGGMAWQLSGRDHRDVAVTWDRWQSPEKWEEVQRGTQDGAGRPHIWDGGRGGGGAGWAGRSAHVTLSSCPEGVLNACGFFRRRCWREGRQRRAGTAWKSGPHGRKRYLLSPRSPVHEGPVGTPAPTGALGGEEGGGRLRRAAGLLDQSMEGIL